MDQASPCVAMAPKTRPEGRMGCRSQLRPSQLVAVLVDGLHQLAATNPDQPRVPSSRLLAIRSRSSSSRLGFSSRELEGEAMPWRVAPQDERGSLPPLTFARPIFLDLPNLPGLASLGESEGAPAPAGCGLVGSEGQGSFDGLGRGRVEWPGLAGLGSTHEIYDSFGNPRVLARLFRWREVLPLIQKR